MSAAARPIVVGVTGASGAVYAVRLVQTLVGLGRETHLTISPSARVVMEHELDMRIASDRFDAADFLQQAWLVAKRLRPNGDEALSAGSPDEPGLLRFYPQDDYMAPIASGSFLTAGMAICPCSGGTLSAVATGASQNLIHRAAHVHLKERRPLVLVPRETPLSLGYLDNLRRACELGAVVLPAMPGWYQDVNCLGDLVDFIVARILDHLDVEHTLSQRWGQ